MFPETQKKRFDAAAEEYLLQIRQDPQVIGVIFSGSYVHAKLGPHSDIDVMVITHPSMTDRERGNTWINGVEIEYFQNPPQQIRAYFERETYRPVTAHMLANGIVRHDIHPEVQAILTEAKTIVAQIPEAWSSFKQEFARYGLDDLRKDLLDCQAMEDLISGRLLAFQLIEECIQVYFGMSRQWGEKKKRLMGFLRKSNPDLSQILQEAIGATDFDQQVQKTILLVEYMETLLGGRRADEWQLKSPLDC
ncbi:MAG: nucleotidyltransferase domain-containing protein [Bacteroidota bacterium]